MSIIKNIAIFAGGAVVGAAAMYIYIDRHCKDDYEIIAQPGIDRNKEDSDKSEETNDDSNQNEEITVERVDADEEIESDVDYISSKNLIRRNSYDADYTDYTDMSEEELEEAAEEAVEKAKQDRESEPEVIDEGMYSETCFDYDKRECVVYTDGMIVDKADYTYASEVAEGLVDFLDTEIIGENIINEFLSSDDEVRYVRNRSMMTDYELWRVDYESREYPNEREPD